MKTKRALLAVIFLGIVIGGSPALAGYYGYGHRPYRYPHYRYHYPKYPHYPSHYYYHSGADVFLGAVFGFALGTLLAPPPANPYYIYRNYPPPPANKEPASPPGDVAARDASCLETREYTTTIVIEGKTLEARGTKCLRPDGNWSYGPVTPIFDQSREPEKNGPS